MKVPLTCVLCSVGKFQIEWEFVWLVYRHMGSETSIYMMWCTQPPVPVRFKYGFSIQPDITNVRGVND